MTLSHLKPRVRRGELSPMEALSALVGARKAGREPKPSLWRWVEQRIAHARRRGGWGEAYMRRGGGRS